MKSQIPKLRFSEFSDKWDVKKLGEITSLITKGTTPSKFVEIGIKFVKIECLEGDYINIDKCLFIDEGTHLKELKRSILNNNDILFAIAGATIGKCCIVSDEVLPANTNQALSIIRLKDDENVQFTFQILTSSKMKRYILDNISVGAQPNLNLEQMGNFTFFVPFREEQTKIANFLTTVDEKIQALKEKKRLLEEYKKGLMKKIFSQEIHFKQEDGSDFPDWEEKSFSNFIKLYRGSSPRPINKYLTNSEDGINWIKIGDMKSVENFKIEKVSEKITLEGSKHSRKVDIGELILANSMSFGKTYQLNISGCIYDGWFVLREYENHYNKDFLIQLLNSDYLQRQYVTLSTGGVVQNISSDIVYSTYLIKPSISEQLKIAKLLVSIDQKISMLDHQLKKTQTFKKGLLQQMFV
jgi:type I restriction enzyme S subunit